MKEIRANSGATGGGQKILIWVAPYHPGIRENLEKKLTDPESFDIRSLSFVWLSPVSFQNHAQKPAYVIDTPEKWLFYLREVRRNDSFAMEAHPRLPAIAALSNYIEEGLRQSALRIKTIEHFYRIWEYNYERNRALWPQLKDLSKAPQQPPDAIVAAGPSVDRFWDTIQTAQVIWCADTALKPLLARGLIPALTFTVDAGYGSFEHFFQVSSDKLAQLSVVADPLSFPAIYDLPFRNIFSYASSHPLFQEERARKSETENWNLKTEIDNKTADVLGFMLGAVATFGFQKPPVFGADGRHESYATHLRGSAYHHRACFAISRWKPVESSFFALSARYS